MVGERTATIVRGPPHSSARQRLRHEDGKLKVELLATNRHCCTLEFYSSTCANRILYASPTNRRLQKRSIQVPLVKGRNIKFIETHKGSGALTIMPLPPMASLVHTSRTNHPTWPTAQPTKSPAAALHVPLMIQLNATSANGR